MSEGAWNSAPRTYLVTGPHTIQGKVAGELVELELTPDQVTALTAAGHIALLPEPGVIAAEVIPTPGVIPPAVVINASDGFNAEDKKSGPVQPDENQGV